MQAEDVDAILQYGLDPVTKAEALGLVCTWPTPHELQIDLDGPADRARFERAFSILSEHIDVKNVEVTPSSGGKGWHVRILLPFEVKDYERVAWQAAMGSDPVRELLALLSLHTGAGIPTVLFETEKIVALLKTKTAPCNFYAYPLED